MQQNQTLFGQPAHLTSVRLMMLQKAAMLGASINNEEAWQLVALYQQSNTEDFLNLTHKILASFMDLTQDHFEEAGFPLRSRFVHQNLLLSTKKLDNNESDELESSIEESDEPEPFSWMKQQNMLFENHPAPIIHSATLSNTSQYQRRRPALFENISRDGILPSMYKPSLDTTSGSNSECSTPKSSRNNSGAEENETDNSTISLVFNSTMNFPNPAFRTNHFQTSVPSFPSIKRAAALGNNFKKNPIGFPVLENMSASKNGSYTKICRYLIDYMLANRNVANAEGLFRRPGNQMRIRELEQRLLHIINDIDYCRMEDPSPTSLVTEICWNFNRSKATPKRLMMYQEFDQFSPHDLACLLIKYIPKCCVSVDKKIDKCLLPPQISELLFMATKLQYSLEKSDKSQDWVEILCHARQILAYRIAIQLLLPRPERKFLMKVLQLFKMVSSDVHSQMSAQSIAICVSMAIFGAPMELETCDKEQMEELTLRLRIDTLTNLIRFADEIHALAGPVYTSVRQNLRAKVGQSPIRKSTKRPDDATNSSCAYSRVDYTPILGKQKLNLVQKSFVCTKSAINRTNSLSAKIPLNLKTQFEVSNKQATVTKAEKLREAFKNWRRVKSSDLSRTPTLINSLQKAKSSIQLKRKHP